MVCRGIDPAFHRPFAHSQTRITQTGLLPSETVRRFVGCCSEEHQNWLNAQRLKLDKNSLQGRAGLIFDGRSYISNFEAANFHAAKCTFAVSILFFFFAEWYKHAHWRLKNWTLVFTWLCEKKQQEPAGNCFAATESALQPQNCFPSLRLSKRFAAAIEQNRDTDAVQLQ